MGFFDFLRSKKPEEQKADREMSLEEIETSLKEEGKKLETSSLKIKERADSLINNIIPSLKESITSLEAIDLEKRREDERLKKLVQESLRVYVVNLEKLVEELEKIRQEKNLKDYIIQTMKIFDTFSRNSAKSYEKARILVGKEFDHIKDILREFSRDFKLIVVDNATNNKRLENLDMLSRILESISETEKIKEDINDNLQKLDTEKSKKELQVKKNEEEIRSFMESEDYKIGLEGIRKAKIELEQLENEIADMKEKINLKELARKYHWDKKRNEIIQMYIKDFKLAMEEDKGIMLAKIAEETSGIDIRIAEINERKNKIEGYLSQNELRMGKIKEEAERFKNEIAKIESRKEAEFKKIEKFDEKKQDLTRKLKSEAQIFFQGR